jgi:hypothetical protein
MIHFVAYCLHYLQGHITQSNLLNEMPDEATSKTSNDTVIILALVLVPIIVLFTILGVALAFSEYWNAGISFCLRCKCLRWRTSREPKRSRSDPPRFSTSTKGSLGTDIDSEMYQKAVELQVHV